MGRKRMRATSMDAALKCSNIFGYVARLQI